MRHGRVVSCWSGRTWAPNGASVAIEGGEPHTGKREWEAGVPSWNALSEPASYPRLRQHAEGAEAAEAAEAGFAVDVYLALSYPWCCQEVDSKIIVGGRNRSAHARVGVKAGAKVSWMDTWLG